MPVTEHRRVQPTHRPHAAANHPVEVSEAHQKGRAARERQRHRHAPAESKMPLVIGGILGAILIVIIAIYLLVGDSAPKPESGSGAKSPAATPTEAPAATPALPVVPTAPATPTPTPMTPPLAQPAP